MQHNKAMNFSLSACNELDAYALLTSQAYNLGNPAHWFSAFRGGLYRFYSRIYGVTYHYGHIFNWTLERKDSLATEFHTSSLLFNMDSAMECLVYSVNALGCAIEPALFQDVSDEKKLRKVAPWNVIESSNKVATGGHCKYFPSFTKYWKEKKSLIDNICEQHDVSKHRSTIFKGGRQRSDAPENFFHKMGNPRSSHAEYFFSPWENIHLRQSPKRTPSRLTTELNEGPVRLEELCENFVEFINTSCQKLLEDSGGSIKLQYTSLLKIKQVVFFPNILLYKNAECTEVEEGVWGLILGAETEGFIVESGTIVPVRRLHYFEKGKELIPQSNHSKVWSKLWYIDPISKEKLLAWENAAEYVGIHADDTIPNSGQ